MEIAKPITPVPAVESGKPRITAAPLADVGISRSARKIAGILQHKRVCHVLGDETFAIAFASRVATVPFPDHIAIDYDRTSKFPIGPGDPINPLLLNCGMTITNMSVFLRMLPAEQGHEAEPKAPSLIKDLILIDSPVLLEMDAFDKLETGLAIFRSAHPHAAVVAGKPADEKALLQMEVLREKGLVDNVAAKAHKSTQLMLCGALILEEKLAKLEAAVHDGNAVLHCSAQDITETVLVEPIKN